jgi:hypothetical protein
MWAEVVAVVERGGHADNVRRQGGLIGWWFSAGGGDGGVVDVTV